MWVWSDELVERVPGANASGTDRVPLVAYAVASEADLDEMAREVLAGVADAGSCTAGASNGEGSAGR